MEPIVLKNYSKCLNKIQYNSKDIRCSDFSPLDSFRVCKTRPRAHLIEESPADHRSSCLGL